MKFLFYNLTSTYISVVHVFLTDQWYLPVWLHCCLCWQTCQLCTPYCWSLLSKTFPQGSMPYCWEVTVLIFSWKLGFLYPGDVHILFEILSPLIAWKTTLWFTYWSSKHVNGRLTNSLMMHGRNNGKKLMAVRIIKHAMEIIHLLSDQNPIQVIVDAIINR